MTESLGLAPTNPQLQAIGRPCALARRFANAAGSRAYDLFVPIGRRNVPLSLVVMLHGCSQSSRDFAIGTRMSELAEEMGFLVAYPDQPRSANMAKSWNWFRDGDQRRDRGEPSIIAGLTRHVVNEFNVDPTRVYVAGLSSGGAAAAVMAVTYPDLYAGVGIHSGLACGSAASMTGALLAMRRGASSRPRRATHSVPTIVFHGDRDTTVSPVNADQAIAQAQPDAELDIATDQGRSDGGTAYTRTVLSRPDGTWSSEQWVLHGARHAWSGGHPAGSHTDPAGPDASREMLRFFMAHPMGRASDHIDDRRLPTGEAMNA
ncbi:PHB depolymerase family esterase [Methylobacterium sp. J-059]|uniref:extracellular catalytic domain type 1 short-chain-length polyhydroxyalkanoate depolymerase n=1 Tax=Methylobacterium sp. J-059 TaxID=2836643 RepID=UPI001FBAECD2|nr:PHB depolymerase family esterase [Methylobacterium sp. J-059]MCJ2041498.1 PHB depolymerase family esterase [Methylobacterium sp. J-059]